MKILRNKEYEDLQRERKETERREFDLRKRLIHACKKNEELKLSNEDLVASNNTLILKNKNLEVLIEDKEKSVKQWSARLGGLTKYNNKLKEDNHIPPRPGILLLPCEDGSRSPGVSLCLCQQDGFSVLP